jgi:DNA-binding Xre family transcriptional regulator
VVVVTGTPDGNGRRSRTVIEPRSPAQTNYPESVLASMTDGKSPLLAWRLYRNMTVKALAEAYGTTTSNMRAMEHNAWLRRTTIEKLCPVLHCGPEHLLRPEGMRGGHDTIQEAALVVAGRAAATTEKVETPASAMEAAFLAAGVVDRRREDNERDRARNGRLQRMQAELARL